MKILCSPEIHQDRLGSVRRLSIINTEKIWARQLATVKPVLLQGGGPARSPTKHSQPLNSDTALLNDLESPN